MKVLTIEYFQEKHYTFFENKPFLPGNYSDSDDLMMIRGYLGRMLFSE